jgi:hypothetical protein
MACAVAKVHRSGVQEAGIYNGLPGRAVTADKRVVCEHILKHTETPRTYRIIADKESLPTTARTAPWMKRAAQLNPKRGIGMVIAQMVNLLITFKFDIKTRLGL